MAGVFISVPGEDTVMTAQGGLAGWAERSALRRVGSLATGGSVPGRLRFVFYGRGAGRGPAGSGDVGRGSGNTARRWYAATRGVGRVGAGAQTMRGNKISRNGDPYQCIPYRMAAADLSFLGTGFMVLIP